MANQQPTVAELQALIQMLQAQVLALQNVAPAIQAAPAAAQVVFANMPQMLAANNLIDYSTKLGKDTYNHGCGALDNKALKRQTFHDSRQDCRLCRGLPAPHWLDGLDQGNQADHNLHQSWRIIYWHHQELWPNWQVHAQDCMWVILQGRRHWFSNSCQAE